MGQKNLKFWKVITENLKIGKRFPFIINLKFSEVTILVNKFDSKSSWFEENSFFF